MNGFLAVLAYLYSWLLRFYPQGVREEYAAEMHHVFLQQLEDRARNGWRSTLNLFVHELLSWPFEVFAAHAADLMEGMPHSPQEGLWQPGLNAIGVFAMSSIEGPPTFGSGRAKRMALPPLLLGLGISLGALIRTDVWYRLPIWQLYLSVAVVLIPGIGIGVMGLRALLQGVPSGGISWLGSAFMGFLVFFQAILGELVDEGMISLAPAVESAFALIFLAAGLLLLLLLARRGWSHAGLFTLAAAATLGLSLLQGVTAAPFNRDDLALLAAPFGLAGSGLIYLFLKESPLFKIGIILGMGILNAGLVLVANNVWSDWTGNGAASDPLMPILIIITGLLLSGPIAGVLVANLKRT